MKNFTLINKYEKNKNQRIIAFNSIKKEKNSNYLSLNPSLSLPSIYKDNKIIKSYKKGKNLQLRNYNKKENMILKRKNFLTPTFKKNIRQLSNDFFTKKDPRETIYNSYNPNKNKIPSNLIINSYNIINKNKNKNEDHVKDLLNYGNRENLYNYIGNKGYNRYNPFPNIINKNFKKLIKEKISNDELNEYYIKNAWSVIEYAYREDPNLKFRQSMEDKGKSIDGFNNNNDSGVFCIFDGHGGNEASTFLQKNIVNYLREYSSNLNLDLDLIFQKLDQNFLNENYNQIGSTACIIYITKEYSITNSKKILYCANIGDTRAVLINSSNIKRLSYDDRATDKNESERIKNLGGVIFGGRVFGNLMLTRAFGDYELKKYMELFVSHI